MASIFKIDLSPLHKLVRNLLDSRMASELYRISYDKSIAAEIGQGIAENFAQEGPGWKPLKAQTIRRSVSKKTKRALSQMTDKEILKHEINARKKESELHKDLRHLGLVKKPSITFRKILQRTGLLKKSVTVPGQQYNIYEPKLGKIVWGTKLKYAGVHNEGFPERNIPKREYLVLKGAHLANIYSIAMKRIKEILWRSINRA